MKQAEAEAKLRDEVQQNEDNQQDTYEDYRFQANSQPDAVAPKGGKKDNVIEEKADQAVKKMKTFGKKFKSFLMD